MKRIGRRLIAPPSLALVVSAVASSVAHAGALPGSSSEASPPRDSGLDSFGPGPIVPRPIAPEPTSYWLVGVGFEHFGSRADDGDTLGGLAASFRTGAFGPYGLLFARPAPDSYADARFLLGLGLRAHFSLFGAHLSYGVGMHGEVRLEDHFWLLNVTPVELGGVVISHRSYDIQLFVGARRPLAGELIQHFLVDPNGFDNELARDQLERTKQRWAAFGRIVFSRRLD